MVDPHLFRLRLGEGEQRALPQELGARPDRPVDRLRSADADRLRQRSRAGEGGGRQGRRAGLSRRRHGYAARRHSARQDEHVDDDQRAGGVAAVALRRHRRAARHPARRALRHHPERHHQGIPVARHLHLSAGAVDAADLRRDRLHLQGSAQVEPDQRLLLPPAGGGSDTGTGAGVRAGHRHRRARRGEGLRPGAGRRLRAGGRPYQLLLQRRHQVRHRVVQDAGVHSPVGRDLPGALRRRGREAAPLPLRRAGQFARAHRAAAGEQRLPHPARDAGRRAVEGRARPRRAASGVERGARPAQAVGPAVVAQAAADRRLRDRPARLRRHLRRLAGNRREGGAARVPGARGARQDRGDGRRRRRRRVRAT